MEVKRKTNVILYTIFMLIVYIGITQLVIFKYGADVLLNAILNAPQGELVISEAVLAALVLIIMLLFGNSYVFTQKKEKFRKGLFYGLFYIIGIVLFLLLYGLLYGGFKGGLSIINLLVGCFFVGVAEEFLCRGWLLNEFLERFRDTKKGIWYSIVISGIIFGLMHIINIYTAGQSVPETIIQVISAAGFGVVIGVIYYKTKNIWTVIAIHGLWDFSLFLGNIGVVKQTFEVISSFSVLSFIFSILMVLAELLNLIPYIKNIDDEPKKGSVILFSIIGFIAYILFMMLSSISITTMGKTYDFDSIEIHNYSIIKDNYEDYFINLPEENISFKLSKNTNGNLIFTNATTNYSIELECESLYDFIIMEEKDYYILAYVDYTNSANPFLKYSYIYKSNISNDNKFLDNIKNNMKKYRLSERSELLVVNDRNNNISYLGAYDEDYGYYLLTSEDKMSILNRD